MARFAGLLLAAAAVASAAAAPKKSVLVSYPQDTPSHVLDQAKEAIREAVH